MIRKPVKRRSLTRARLLSWAQMAHVFYLSALMAESRWKTTEIAFHGGTSLHLSWQSARFSEDIDFLLSREIDDVRAVSRRVLADVRERFRVVDPEFQVEMRDKTRDVDRMLVFSMAISHPAYFGTAKVKVGFWRIDSEYLNDYPTELRTPIISRDLLPVILNPVPAATLETAYADKLTAFATRPRVKWRDIYDLWWIGTQSRARIDPQAVARQFLHNVSAYETRDGLPPSGALRLFLGNDPEQLIEMADPHIKRWLPEKIWNAFYPDAIEQMVAHAFSAIGDVVNILDDQADRAHNLERTPRPKF